MDRTEPARPTLAAFVKVVTKSPKSRHLNNRLVLAQLSRPEVREELTLQGVAVLSDN